MEQQFLQVPSSYVEYKYILIVCPQCLCQASYYASYMTKVDISMTSAFRRICKEHETNHIDTMQMIRALGNTLLNLQQMFAQQTFHVALSLPLDCDLRKCVFTNTSPLEKCKLEHGFTFGPPKILLK